MQWALVVYLLIFTAAQGQDEEATDKFCSGIHDKLQELKEATKTLCGTNVTEPDIATNRQLVTWTSIDQTAIGSTDFRSTGTLSYEIPSIIPDDANEVLILAFFHAAGSSGSHSFFKIYTEGENGEEYAKYMALTTGSRSYYYTNTDNLWFPMTNSRRVYLSVPSALSGSIYGNLYVIGYRSAQ